MLTEVDLIRGWLREDKTLKVMDKLAKKQFKTHKERVKYYLKLFYKVWNALTKYVKAQTSQGKLVAFPLIGSFYQNKGAPVTGDQDTQGGYWFIPNPSFLDEGKFDFKPDEHNKNPYEVPKRAVAKVNASSIAEVWETTTNTALFVLKKIVRTVILNSRSDIKLDFRIGYLKVIHHQLSFEPSGLHSRWLSSDNPFDGLEAQMDINLPKEKRTSRRTTNSAYSTIRVPRTSMSNRLEIKQYINASNPNPQSGAYRYPQNNKYVIGFHKKGKKSAFAGQK